MTRIRLKRILCVILCLAAALSLYGVSASANDQPTLQQTGAFILSCGSGQTLYGDHGSLWSWGLGTYGQLGNGGESDSAVPVRVASQIISCAAGDGISYVVDRSGSLYAWGKDACFSNYVYQQSSVPVKLGKGYASVSAAGTFAFAVGLDGSLYAWGSSLPSWLSSLSNGVMKEPTKVADGVKAVSCDLEGVLIIYSDGTARHTSEAGTVDIRIAGAVVSGASYSGGGFLLNSLGELYGWGNLAGGGSADRPLEIGSGVRQVSCGADTVFILYQSGALYAFGDNRFGQAAAGAAAYLTSPVLVTQDVAAVSAGDRYAAAVKTNGEVWTWGRDQNGELGNGVAGLSYNVPYRIIHGTGIKNLSGSLKYTVAVNGSSLSFDVAPVNRSGRLLVPFRAIFEALGARVEWDDASDTAVAYGADGSVVSIQLGSAAAYVNGVAYTLDVPAAIVSSRCMVPVRFVSEAFGAEVDYIDSERMVDIRTGKYIPEPVSTDDLLISQNVYIEAGNSKIKWCASGVVVDSSGLILTNRHVVDGASWIKAYIGNNVYTLCELYHVDTDRDFALFRVKADYPLFLYGASLGDSDSLALGDSLITCGNPKGIRDQVSRGQVESLFFFDARSPGSMLTSVPAQPGSSGSGVYDSELKLVGVIWGSNQEGTLSVFVPLTHIQSYISLSLKTENPGIAA